MKQADVIVRANEFVLRHTGVTAAPASVKLVERPGVKYWAVVYPAEALFVREAAGGVTIDGPYVLRVDEASGKVSVLG